MDEFLSMLGEELEDKSNELLKEKNVRVALEFTRILAWSAKSLMKEAEYFFSGDTGEDALMDAFFAFRDEFADFLGMQAMVRRFHRKFGIPTPGIPGIRRGDLRIKLLREECEETCQAIEKGDLVGAIDGLCDLVYVALGTAEEFGIPLMTFFREVHRSNMTKEGGGEREDGKILKGPNWEPPRIAAILEVIIEATKKPRE